MPQGTENEMPPWKHRWLGWKSSSFGYLSCPIQKTTKMGILRSRIRTMLPEVEATRKITKIVSRTTTKVTIVT